MEKVAHGGLAPSDWVRRWGRLVPAGGTVLDVACGQGRHVRWFAALFNVTPVLLAGVVGGMLGLVLQRRGIVPGARGRAEGSDT
jgi:hypothetical protein